MVEFINSSNTIMTSFAEWSKQHEKNSRMDTAGKAEHSGTEKQGESEKMDSMNAPRKKNEGNKDRRETE